MPQVERRARPAPIFDLQLGDDKRLGPRIRRHLLFATIPRDRLTIDHTRRVLPAQGSFTDLFQGDPPQGLQNLKLLVTHRLGFEDDRWLHRDDRQELQHVVDNHVPKSANLIVVATP